MHAAVWPQQKWAENWGGALPLFGEGRAGSPSKTKSPGLRPSFIPSGILIHAAIWPQQIWAENWGLCPFGGGGAGSPSNTMSRRQARCCLQVKLCDSCLSALYVPWCKKALYKYSSFPFLWNMVGHYIFALWFLSFFFLSFSSPNLSGRRLDVYHTSTHGVAVVRECMSEMCCTRLAEDTGRKNDAKNCHLRTIAQLCRAVSSQLRHILTIGKNLLNSNVSPRVLTIWWTSPLANEICRRVWGTTANFKGFRVFVALLHDTLVVGVSQTLRRWTEARPIFGRAAITLGIGPHF